MGKVDFVHRDLDRTTIRAAFFPASERKSHLAATGRVEILYRPRKFCCSLNHKPALIRRHSGEQRSIALCSYFSCIDFHHVTGDGMSPISRAFDGFFTAKFEREVGFGSCQIAISGPFGTRPKLQRDVPSGLIESAHGSALADCLTETTRVVQRRM